MDCRDMKQVVFSPFTERQSQSISQNFQHGSCFQTAACRQRLQISMCKWISNPQQAFCMCVNKAWEEMPCITDPCLSKYNARPEQSTPRISLKFLFLSRSSSHTEKMCGFLKWPMLESYHSDDTGNDIIISSIIWPNASLIRSSLLLYCTAGHSS